MCQNFKKSYCHYAKLHGGVHKQYHDNEYGFPLHSDEELFGRFILEINQAGLSWDLILKKKDGFKDVYGNFNIDTIANFNEEDINRILLDKKIIRNKLKVKAVIYNAKKIIELQKKYGSFKKWLEINSGKTKIEWVSLFKKVFKFTGGEITNEFLLSTGYLKGAHHPDCEMYHKILKLKPEWYKFD